MGRPSPVAQERLVGFKGGAHRAANPSVLRRRCHSKRRACGLPYDEATGTRNLAFALAGPSRSVAMRPDSEKRRWLSPSHPQPAIPSKPERKVRRCCENKRRYVEPPPFAAHALQGMVGIRKTLVGGHGGGVQAADGRFQSAFMAPTESAGPAGKQYETLDKLLSPSANTCVADGDATRRGA